MKPEISAALIVKDEEAVLERCLRSLQGLDEVVVYDTGSLDRSRQIAQDMGAKVIGGLAERPFHFARARNVALARVRSDWTLSIDADEVLREGSLGVMFRAVGKKLNTVGYEVHYVNRAEEGGTEMPGRKLRLFRSELFAWKYRIDEQLIPKGASAKVRYLENCILDHLPQASKEGRRAQNLELLKLCVQESPGHMQVWKKLGIEHILREEWKEAVEPLEHYLKKPDRDPPHEDCAVRMFLGKCHARLRNMDQALRYFHEAHQKAPKRREPLYWAALELIRFGDPWTAIEWLQGALKVPPDPMPEFSLYSEEVQGTLVEETLRDWRQKLKEAKEAWEAGKRPDPTR